MDKLALLTETVSPDESCWWLVEVITTPTLIHKKYPNLPMETMKGRRRYQIVTVNRGDRLARHITDMGDAALYDCGGLNMPGWWENTVAQLREVAGQWREDQSWEKEILANAAGESRLMKAWFEQMEQRRRVSVFGPHVVVQR